MSILVIMIPLSLLFVFAAGVAFFWAVNHDQFDDMDSPGLLPVSDDLPEPASASSVAADPEASAQDTPEATDNTGDTDDTDKL